MLLSGPSVTHTIKNSPKSPTSLFLAFMPSANRTADRSVWKQQLDASWPFPQHRQILLCVSINASVCPCVCVSVILFVHLTWKHWGQHPDWKADANTLVSVHHRQLCVNTKADSETPLHTVLFLLSYKFTAYHTVWYISNKSKYKIKSEGGKLCNAINSCTANEIHLCQM